MINDVPALSGRLRTVRWCASGGALIAAAVSMMTSGANAAPVVPAPAAFAVCTTCHAIEPGKTRIGPSLAGIANRKAGAVDGFTYSAAMRASNLVWNAVNLDRYLAGPSALVPGTRMTFAGVKDAQRRRDIVEYLMTLKN